MPQRADRLQAPNKTISAESLDKTERDTTGTAVAYANLKLSAINNTIAMRKRILQTENAQAPYFIVALGRM